MKAKCEKGKNGKWAFNKPLGVCVSADGEDKPMCEDGEDCEDMPHKPDCEEEECDEKPEKPMCDEEDEDCEEMEDKPEKPMCDDEEEDCEDMEHPEKPDMGEGESMGTIVVGDDGKWQKCQAELEEMDINGEAKCEDVICHVMCMDGFVVE